MKSAMRLTVFVAVAAFGCGGVTAMMDPDAGDGGAAGTTGAAGSSVGGGSGGSAACEQGAERCECYGNGTCNAGLACLSDLCVSAGGAGGGSGSLGGGGSGGGARGGVTGTAGAGGTGSIGGPCSAGCPTGSVCASGVCMWTCPTSTMMCSDNQCVAIGGEGTLKRCGGCNACPAGATACLSGGICGCAGTDKLCGNSCVNTNTSNTHCGGCNQPCTGGTCTSGVCVKIDGGS